VTSREAAAGAEDAATVDLRRRREELHVDLVSAIVGGYEYIRHVLLGGRGQGDVETLRCVDVGFADCRVDGVDCRGCRIGRM